MTMLAFVAFAAPIRAGCTRRIAANGPSARVIVLAGGDAWLLFQQYLSEVKQRDLDVSLWQSTVMISVSGRQESVKLGWAKMLTGESSERLWERALSGRKADVNADLLAQGDGSAWDIICAGQAAAAKKGPTSPLTAPAGAAAARLLST